MGGCEYALPRSALWVSWEFVRTIVVGAVGELGGQMGVRVWVYVYGCTYMGGWVGESKLAWGGVGGAQRNG